MTITAKIVLDSISPQGVNLTTMLLRYPKFIHGELMTHRVFSRNASSSRAVPVFRLIEDVRRDPVRPSFWGKNQSGMQAAEELTGEDLFSTQMEWQHALDEAVNRARRMANNGAHKQIVNRVLEPYSHINVLVSSTEWANFYALRRHPDAQPEMKALAHAMYDAKKASCPTLLQPGQWHLPFIAEEDRDKFPEEAAYAVRPENLIKISVARCARLSYLTHEGSKPTIESDLKLYDRLVGSSPLHASPAEHQATPDTCHGDRWPVGFKCQMWWDNWHEHGNFTGWRQFRKQLENEAVSDR